jgi:hypothetical protein
MIHRALGHFEVDWGKNNVFTMHGALFKPGDVTQVAYRYVDDDGKIVIERHEGTARPLVSVVPRLELLGDTLKGARCAFEAVLTSLATKEPLVTFAILAEALQRVHVEEGFCQVVEAESLSRRMGIPPQAYLSLRQPASYPQSRPNSRIGSSSLGGSQTLTTDAVVVESVGQMADDLAGAAVMPVAFGVGGWSHVGCLS